MLKIVTVIGVRPEFIKAIMVTKAVVDHNAQHRNPQIEEIIVHTGQHYDREMSQIFFDQLDLPRPHYNVGVSDSSHGRMTGAMLEGIEKILIDEKPDWVIVYGDTNSTLAGALAAVKLHIPVAHIQSGLRSFNRRMPEEINRVLTDHMSSCLFSPTDESVQNLAREGIENHVYQVGDVNCDAFEFFKPLALNQSTLLEDMGLTGTPYALATVHRQENTDDLSKLNNIFDAFFQIAESTCPIVLPVHPRTRKIIETNGLDVDASRSIRMIAPVGFFDIIALTANARFVLTDSGGMQKEAYFAKVPCITLRDETEWVETVEAGANVLSGTRTEDIVAAVDKAVSGEVVVGDELYGNGKAGEKIVKILSEFRI